MIKGDKVRNTYVLLLIVMCLISFGFGYFIFYKMNAHEIRHIPIDEGISLDAITVKPNTHMVKNSYIGHTLAIHQANIVPFISGYLDDIKIKEGSTVKQGELLFTLNKNEYAAKLEAAKASVAQSLAELEYSKNYYERVKKSGEKAFSVVEIDNAKNNYLQAEAALKNAKANELLAQVYYDYTNIYAPIDGAVGNFSLTKGNFVSPENGALLNIIQINPIRVVFSITDAEFLDIFKNSDSPFKNSVIKITNSNGETYEYEGKYKYIDNKINSSTNTLAVFVDFENNEKKLLPNAFVTVEVYKKIDNTISINKDIVNMKENGNFINIARENKIISEPIKILSEQDNSYIIENSLQPNDLIIINKTAQIGNDKSIHFNILK